MTASVQKVNGQLNSIKTTMFNMIGDLRTAEDHARAEGKTHAADQLAYRRLMLSDQCALVRRAETAAIAGGSLTQNIRQLQNIASDMKKASKTAKTMGEILSGASRIISTLKKISTLF